MGDDALGVKPAWDAPGQPGQPPASTPLRMASAMRSGCWARVTAGHQTPSHPSSMAMAASEAVPIPASRITGTVAASRMMARLYGLRMPIPLPIGAPSGMTAAQPRRSRPGDDRVVVGVGENDETVVDQLLGGDEQLHGIGQKRAFVADDFELHPVGLQRLAGQLGREHGVAGGEAPGRVRQHPDPAAFEDRQDRPRAAGVDAAHGHGGQLGPRRGDGLLERVEAGRSPVPRISREPNVTAGDDERIVRVNLPVPRSGPRRGRRLGGRWRPTGSGGRLRR